VCKEQVEVRLDNSIIQQNQKILLKASVTATHSTPIVPLVEEIPFEFSSASGSLVVV